MGTGRNEASLKKDRQNKEGKFRQAGQAARRQTTCSFWRSSFLATRRLNLIHRSLIPFRGLGVLSSTWNEELGENKVERKTGMRVVCRAKRSDKFRALESLSWFVRGLESENPGFIKGEEGDVIRVEAGQKQDPSSCSRMLILPHPPELPSPFYSYLSRENRRNRLISSPGSTSGQGGNKKQRENFEEGKRRRSNRSLRGRRSHQA